MCEFWFCIFGLCCFIALVSEVSNIFTFDGYIKKQKRDKLLSSVKNYDNLNRYDKRILKNSSELYNFGCHFITTTCFGIVAKYYINDVGMIPRFTKLHYLVKEKFKELKQKI